MRRQPTQRAVFVMVAVSSTAAGGSLRSWLLGARIAQQQAAELRDQRKEAAFTGSGGATAREVPAYVATVPMHLSLEAPIGRECEAAMPLLEAIARRARRLGVPVDSRIERSKLPTELKRNDVPVTTFGDRVREAFSQFADDAFRLAGIVRVGMPRSSQRAASTSPAGNPPASKPYVVSDELERWLNSEGEKTLGSIIELFEEKSFALLFILLLGVSALPLPTGGATHVLEIIAVLLALQLIIGRDQTWLPRRWRRLQLAGDKQQRFITRLMRVIRRLESISRPRLTFLFGHRLTNVVFGALVTAGSIAAFAAPPFSGLDTLPSLGVVLLSLGVLLEDFGLVVVALVAGAFGVLLEVLVGGAAIKGIGDLF